jgi:hypothetical protein
MPFVVGWEQVEAELVFPDCGAPPFAQWLLTGGGEVGTQFHGSDTTLRVVRVQHDGAVQDVSVRDRDGWIDVRRCRLLALRPPVRCEASWARAGQRVEARIDQLEYDCVGKTWPRISAYRADGHEFFWPDGRYASFWYDEHGEDQPHRIDGPALRDRESDAWHESFYLFGVGLDAASHAAVVANAEALEMFRQLANDWPGTGNELASGVLLA